MWSNKKCVCAHVWDEHIRHQFLQMASTLLHSHTQFPWSSHGTPETMTPLLATKPLAFYDLGIPLEDWVKRTWDNSKQKKKHLHGAQYFYPPKLLLVSLWLNRNMENVLFPQQQPITHQFLVQLVVFLSLLFLCFCFSFLCCNSLKPFSKYTWQNRIHLIHVYMQTLTSKRRQVVWT